MRNQSFISLGNIINITLTDLEKEKNNENYAILEKWQEVVGKDLFKVTKPINIKWKTLFVNVENPAMLQKLSFLKKELLDKINRQLLNNPIEKIHFRIGQVS